MCRSEPMARTTTSPELSPTRIWRGTPCERKTPSAYCATDSFIRSRRGSRSLRASSGSRSASNSIEPLRSAKRTVTCLRSPSRALLEVWIFSARCFGVYEAGVVTFFAVLAAAATACPHAKQNAAPAGSSVPHFAQASATLAPHFMQKRAWDGLASPQHGQVIPRRASRRRPRLALQLLEPVRHAHLAVHRARRLPVHTRFGALAGAAGEFRETGVAVGDQGPHCERRRAFGGLAEVLVGDVHIVRCCEHDDLTEDPERPGF